MFDQKFIRCRHRLVSAALSLAFVMAGTARAQDAYRDDYSLQAQDIIIVTVYPEEALTREGLIRRNGGPSLSSTRMRE